ncbi:hypothetical protein E3N88_40908 [Mikania micrantha]|uniref:VOC domain-containing protein n=1 Tax=Mikania micrantha TaxID=192012 RepID=A0A5N6LPY0_9ASTR|nr:hypothetical protein E3N88_40908 [Mikania micrantha]
MKEIDANPLFLKSLNHISLQCHSVQESVDFYTKILGFVQVKRPGYLDFDGAWLFSYGIGIHLIQSEEPDDVPKKSEINTKDNHISFQFLKTSFPTLTPPSLWLFTPPADTITFVEEGSGRRIITATVTFTVVEEYHHRCHHQRCGRDAIEEQIPAHLQTQPVRPNESQGTGLGAENGCAAMPQTAPGGNTVEIQPDLDSPKAAETPISPRERRYTSIGAVEKKLKEITIDYKRQRVKEGEIHVDQLFFHDPNGFMIEICNCDILPVIPIAGDMIRSCSRLHVPTTEPAVTSTKILLFIDNPVSDSHQHTSQNDLFGQVIKDCDGHAHQLQALLRKMQEEGSSNQTSKNADHFGALIHHLSLVRNKRCLMAYVYNRAEVIQSLGWTIKHDTDLPDAIEKKLSDSENEYFKKHYKNLQSYMTDLDLDLAVDMVPPKDPYIKVRVLEELGDGIVLGDQVANLPMHAILFVKRIDAESYISQALFRIFQSLHVPNLIACCLFLTFNHLNE